jgi:signal transduction histidine kinase
MAAWSGWSSGSAFIASAAAILAAFVVPVVVNLVFTHPEGRVGRPALRLLVLTAWAWAAVSALLLALFRDPFFDVDCWSNCTDNVFLVANRPGLARAVERAGSGVTIALSLALVAGCAWRAGRRAGHQRLLFAPVAVAGVLFGGGMFVHELALMRTKPEDPTNAAFFTIFLILSTGAVLLAAGLVLPLVREWAARRALRRLVGELGDAPAPGALEGALRGALGDPSLTLEFWLRDARRFANARGQAIPDEHRLDGRASVTVRRRDDPVAVIRFDPAPGADVVTQMGAATRLALENERIRVELLAQLDELTQSRRRIIEIEDDERRRIERDLHDGVQQELLALSSELRASRSAAEQETIRTVLDEAIRKTHIALTEVRELAHGVFPAILTDAGLAAAIESLADRAAVTVVVEEVPQDRLASAVETTAYQVADAAIARAEALGSVVSVRLTARRERDMLVVEGGDDDLGRVGERSGLPEDVEERVHALGGRVVVERVPGRGTIVRAEIPCA